MEKDINFENEGDTRDVSKGDEQRVKEETKQGDDIRSKIADSANKGKIQAQLMQEMLINENINILNSFEYSRNNKGQEVVNIQESEWYFDGNLKGASVIKKGVAIRFGGFTADGENTGGEYIKEIVKDEKTGRIGMLIVGDSSFELDNPIIDNISNINVKDEAYFFWKDEKTGLLHCETVKEFEGGFKGKFRLENPLGGNSVELDIEGLDGNIVSQLPGLLEQLGQIISSFSPEDQDAINKLGNELSTNMELAIQIISDTNLLIQKLREYGCSERVIQIFEGLAQDNGNMQ